MDGVSVRIIPTHSEWDAVTVTKIGDTWEVTFPRVKLIVQIESEVDSFEWIASCEARGVGVDEID